MGLYCIVNDCKSTQYRRVNEENEVNVPLFKFPTDTLLREKWVEALRTLNNQENASNRAQAGKVCAMHFSNECIERRGSSQYRLKPNSVPSIFPRNNSTHSHLTDVSNMEPTLEDCATEQASTSTSLMPAHFCEFKCEFIKEEVMDSEAEKSVDEYLIGINNDVSETDEHTGNAIYATPQKSIRYPGDISTLKVENMTPATLRKCVRVLKKSCEKKSEVIKKLRTQTRRQKKRIASLKILLHELRNKYNLRVQYSSAHKPLLHCNEDKSSADGNYNPTDTTSVLTISS
ncbi:uncharacterized protein LOC108622239 isoform X2 [Ceratina calcarata]|uniref:Uncharacterized protein LOC108622239 isoform X2 n=1 Tax=Ceratina calcarata TaxID=156304 RepID=A0AAJ7IRI9_9HYME|nr:uncharacterized protein LOC108622239 isoform X2 [Ceratina calcarata]